MKPGGCVLTGLRSGLLGVRLGVRLSVRLGGLLNGLLNGLLCASWPAAAACPLPAPALQQGDVQAAWKVDGAPIGVGQHFALNVQVCPATAVLTRVDAVMPEHRHGMNYRPTVKPLGDGRWRAEGLLFHMPGRWQLRLDVQAAGRTEKLLDTITLP